MKSYFIKLAFFLFGMGLFAQEIQVLKSSAYPMRTNDILSNTLMIRLRPEYTMPHYSDQFMKELDIASYSRMLNPENTVLLNYLNNYSKLSVHSNLDKLLEAESKLIRTFRITFEGDIAPEEYAKYLKKKYHQIETISTYPAVKLLSSNPNDDLINQQSMLNLINAYALWDVEDGDESIIIGISDSGTNQDHPDLTGNIAVNSDEIPDNGIDDDENGYIDDYRGYNFDGNENDENWGNTFSFNSHGTETAGIAAASTNNTTGIAGVANQCKFFPLKISRGNSGTLLYSYESLVYAANNGFKVLNMSWGSANAYSEINQSIVDYAVANDVALVASAGNQLPGVTIYDTFYPAGYKGVLGVGEVDQQSVITYDNTVLGISCEILAPGKGNWATTGENNYTRMDDGTSYSSPVVAGALALLRLMHPELSAEQSLEFIRQCSRDISGSNPMNQELQPGLLDMGIIAELDPYSITGFTIEEVTYYDSNDNQILRLLNGDNAKVRILIKNHLGDANDVSFTLSDAFDSGNTLEVTQNSLNVETIPGGDEYLLAEFEIEINNDVDEQVIMRLDISSDGYSDFLKFGIQPNQKYTNFANENIMFSMSDIGFIGFASDDSEAGGVGFRYLDEPNALWRESGLIFANDLEDVSAARRRNYRSVKGFSGDNQNVNILDDSFMGTPIGTRITQEILFTDIESKAARFDITVENISNSILENISIGYHLDWDIGEDIESNSTNLLPQAIPDGFEQNKTAAQYASSSEDATAIYGAIVYSEEEDAVAQASGLNFNLTSGSNFNDNQIMTALYSGTSYQEGIEEFDISFVVGSQFTGTLGPGATRSCSICIGAGDTMEELANELRDCILTVKTSVEDKFTDNEIKVYPNPFQDIINIGYDYNFNKIEIVDVNGQLVFETNRRAKDLNLSNLSTGVYLLKLYTFSNVITSKIMKVN